MSELTYENSNGDTVYTSTYLKNRGTCCQTSCLHCPYGYTLKTEGLKFEDVTKERLEEAQFILNGGKKKEEFSISASLLAGAFGAPKKIIAITVENKGNYQFIMLKDQVCGLVRKSTTQAQEFFLLEHYKNQGISLAMVNT